MILWCKKRSWKDSSGLVAPPFLLLSSWTSGPISGKGLATPLAVELKSFSLVTAGFDNTRRSNISKGNKIALLVLSSPLPFPLKSLSLVCLGEGPLWQLAAERGAPASILEARQANGSDHTCTPGSLNVGAGVQRAILVFNVGLLSVFWFYFTDQACLSYHDFSCPTAFTKLQADPA